jgi:hypothetical protein
MSFSIGCAESLRGTRAVDQHKVARLPVGNIDRRDTSCAGARIILNRCFGREFGPSPEG